MRLAVCTLVWKRPERLSTILDGLMMQTDLNFDLHIINNNPALREFVDELAAGIGSTTIVHNDANLGAFVRMEYAHRTPGYDFWCFVDDDMLFPTDYVDQVKREANPDALVGWRAWKFGATYWDKLHVAIGQPASIVIACGMVAPAELLADDAILGLTDPKRRNCDDLWLSYIASHLLGYRLMRGNFTGCDVVVDGKDTYLTLHDVKNKFLAELRGLGWLE